MPSAWILLTDNGIKRSQYIIFPLPKTLRTCNCCFVLRASAVPPQANRATTRYATNWSELSLSCTTFRRAPSAPT